MSDSDHSSDDRGIFNGKEDSDSKSVHSSRKGTSDSDTDKKNRTSDSYIADSVSTKSSGQDSDQSDQSALKEQVKAESEDSKVEARAAEKETTVDEFGEKKDETLNNKDNTETDSKADGKNADGKALSKGNKDDDENMMNNVDEDLFENVAPTSYRKKFSNNTEFIEAKLRQLENARLKHITEDGQLIPNWISASPSLIGEKSMSVGLKLYFLWLKNSCRVIFIWALTTTLLIWMCVPVSEGDQKYQIGGLAHFSIASFGNTDTTVPIGERKVRIEIPGIYSGTLLMRVVTPFISLIMVIGAIFYFFYALWFQSFVVILAAEELDKAAITPSDFTIQCDYLPNELIGDDGKKGKIQKIGGSIIPMHKVAPEGMVIIGEDRPLQDGENQNFGVNLLAGNRGFVPIAEGNKTEGNQTEVNLQEVTIDDGLKEGTHSAINSSSANNLRDVHNLIAPIAKNIGGRNNIIRRVYTPSITNNSPNSNNKNEYSPTTNSTGNNTHSPLNNRFGQSPPLPKRISYALTSALSSDQDEALQDPQRKLSSNSSNEFYINSSSIVSDHDYERHDIISVRESKRHKCKFDDWSKSGNSRVKASEVKRMPLLEDTTTHRAGPPIGLMKHPSRKMSSTSIGSSSSSSKSRKNNFVEQFSPIDEVAIPIRVSGKQKKFHEDFQHCKTTAFELNQPLNLDLREGVHQTDGEKKSPRDNDSKEEEGGKNDLKKDDEKLEDEGVTSKEDVGEITPLKPKKPLIPPEVYICNEYHQTKYYSVLKEHFEKLVLEERQKKETLGFFVPPVDLGPPTVVEISFARDWNGSLLKLKETNQLKRKQLEARMDKDHKKIEQLESKLQEKESDLLHLEIVPEKRKVMRAFVTFNLSYDKELCQEVYDREKYPQFVAPLFRSLFQDKRKRLQGYHALKVRGAPEPTNILWQNQDVQFFESWWKYFFVLFLTVIVLGIAAGLVFGTQLQREHLSKDSSPQKCGASVTIQNTESPSKKLVFTPTVADQFIANTTMLGLPSPTFTDCQCAQLGTVDIFLKSEYNDACSDYASGVIVLTLLVAFAASLSIIGINLFLNLVIQKIVAWERPLTESQFQEKIVKKVFLAQFINTSIIIVALNAKPVKKYIQSVPGEYEDFNYYWYSTVGVAIMLTLLINIFSPHLIDVIIEWFRSLQRKYCCLRQCPLIKSEEDLERIFAPREFKYAARCGALLNTIFSTISFSPGLPLLVWFLLFNNFCCYWCDKYIVLRLCAKPPSYNESIMKETLNFIPFAFLIHGVIGVWMLGNTETFPSDRIMSFQDLLGLLLGSTKTTEDDLGIGGKFISRGLTWAGLPYLGLVIIVITVLILKLVNRILGGALYSMFCGPCIRILYNGTIIGLYGIIRQGNNQNQERRSSERRSSERRDESMTQSGSLAAVSAKMGTPPGLSSTASSAKVEGDVVGTSKVVGDAGTTGSISTSVGATRAIGGSRGSTIISGGESSMITAALARGKTARIGFAEDETTFLEHKQVWIDNKLCSGYQLSDHPDWRSLLVGTKLYYESPKPRTKKLSAVLLGKKELSQKELEKNSSTVVDEEDSEDEFSSSSTEVDDE